MTRQKTRVYPHLDTKATKSLPMDEVRVILRAADDIIDAGGRTLLTKILRGSRSQDVLSRGLDQNPAYGLYKALPEEEVLARIDWTILHGYLRIVFEGRLPVLVYTPTGWGIERETYANEIIHAFDRLLDSAQRRPYALDYLKDKNRELILLVLEKIQALGDRKYVPVLEDWAQLDYKKVRQRIREVTRYCMPLTMQRRLPGLPRSRNQGKRYRGATRATTSKSAWRASSCLARPLIRSGNDMARTGT
jgi:hypothetical protein